MGLFAARVLGEAIGLPGVWAAGLLGALLAGGGAWLLARWPLGRTWPALLLLAYVVWPEVNPAARLWLPGVAVVVLLLHERARGAGGERWSLTDRRLTLAISAALFVAALALYVATLAPDVLAADSGELQTVAAQLGVAHPPGFPLYVLLAHLFTRLPVGSPAHAVNLLSAVFAALTVVVVYRTGLLLAGRHLAALVGALALGTATTFWSQATTANVRSLTALFAALFIYALVCFGIATSNGSAGMGHGGRPIRQNTTPADRALIWAALFIGFGLTHHVSLVFLAAVGLVFVVVVDRSLLRSPRRWGRPLMAALLGLLPLLYLPLRAGADARGASPQLATLPGFLEHVLATGFRGDLFYYLAPADLTQRLGIMGNVMTFQFAPLLLAGMVVGLLLLLWRDRPMAWLLGGSFAVYVFVAATYRAPQTVEYMMPAYVPAALAVAVALGRWPLARPRWRGPGPALGALFAALMLAAALSQLPGHISAAGARHEAGDARAVATRLLAEAPPNAIILAHWHWATPLWYLREVEGLRPDVDVRFVFPEGETYEATWARRTAAAFAEGRPVVTTWLPAAPLANLPVPEPLGEALLYPQTPRTALPAGYETVDLSLGESIAVVGYRLETNGAFAPGEEAVLTLAWRPRAELSAGLGLYAHLVAAGGALYAQDDRPALAAAGLTLTQFRLTPRPATPAGALTLFVGASDGGERQALVMLPLGPGGARPFTRNPVFRAATDGLAGTLIGYDWDHTIAGRARLYLHWRADDGYTTQAFDDAAPALLLPYRGPWGVPVRDWRFPRGQADGHYVPLGQGIVWTGETLDGLSLAPGAPVVLGQRFHSGRPVNRDLVVSVRLIGLEPDGFHWAWWDLRDSVPALGAIPTLKWVAGSAVRSPHRVTAATGAPPGQALTGALTLYDAFTGRPLPILDERIPAGQPWIPLGQGVVVGQE